MSKSAEETLKKRRQRDEAMAHARANIVTDNAEGVSAGPPPKGMPGTWAAWCREYGGGGWPWQSEAFLLAVCHPVHGLDVTPLPNLPAGADAKRLREHAGLSREAVAERLAVPLGMLEAFEDGREVLVPGGRFLPADFRTHATPDAARRLYGALSLTVKVGATKPAPVVAEPVKAAPVTVLAPEALDEVVAFFAGHFGMAPEQVDPVQLMLHPPTAQAVVEGSIPTPTLTDWPSAKELVKLLRVFPAVARGRSIWTGSGVLGNLLDDPSQHTDAPFVTHDTGGHGRAGQLRGWGTLFAVVQAHPELVDAVERQEEAERQAREQAEADEAAAVAARLAAEESAG